MANKNGALRIAEGFPQGCPHLSSKGSIPYNVCKIYVYRTSKKFAPYLLVLMGVGLILPDFFSHIIIILAQDELPTMYCPLKED